MNRKELIAIRLDLISRDFDHTKKTVLIAVTKRSPFSDIKAAYEAGQRDFGENRVDELVEKADEAKSAGLDDIRWHFVGNLQSKKMLKLLEVERLYAIHSIDSRKQIEQLRESELKRNEDGLKKTSDIRVFLQVNTSSEKEKSGFKEWDDLSLSANKLIAMEDSCLKLYGLMTMSRVRTNHFAQDARKCFKQLSLVADTLAKEFDITRLKLSIGMSSDYKIALEEGADYIRLGSQIFSEDQNS
jgi:pyridoxal phosphate enzyme (YggS family)